MGGASRSAASSSARGCCELTSCVVASVVAVVVVVVVSCVAGCGVVAVGVRDQSRWSTVREAGVCAWAEDVEEGGNHC